MKNLWIDTDIALGSASGDVDDGHALAYALGMTGDSKGNPHLLGVSAVGGNTDAQTALRCAQALLDKAGSPLKAVPAGQAAAQALLGLPDGTHILALGPLSNLALAIQADPSWAARMEVSTVAGVLWPWRSPLLPFSCLNFRKDPAAANRVTQAAWRVRHRCPLDVVKRLRLNAQGLRQLAQAGPADGLAAYLAQHSWRWLAQAPIRHARLSFPVWDLVAVMDALGALPQAEHAHMTGPQGTVVSTLMGFDVAGARSNFMNAVMQGFAPHEA